MSSFVHDRLDLDDLSVERVVDLDSAQFSIYDIYPDATPDSIPSLRGWLGPEVFGPESANLLLSFHALLVRSNGKTILVDTCCGNDKQRPERLAESCSTQVEFY